ncbi:MAG: hypothetical protein K5679_05430 [Lachnospiraceae bacterium]|nr:hypothetical protein [Lachnospiraceae bacterium]
MGYNDNNTDDEVYILVDEDGNEVFLDDDADIEDSGEYAAEAEPKYEADSLYDTKPVYAAEPEGDTVLYNKYDVEEALSDEVGEVELEEEYELEEPSYDTGVIDFDEEDDPRDEIARKGGGNIILLAGALVIVFAAVLLGVIYFAKKTPKDRGIDFSTVGTNVATIGVIGEDNINAITAAEGTRLDALYEAQKSYDYEEADQEGGVSSVNVTLTSIVKDLKIKIVNSKDKLIGNVPFVVEVTTPAGKTEKWEDDNKDGIIYKTDLDGGIYKVKIVPLNGYDSMYDFSTATIQSITVKTQLDYQKVNVKNEIKKSSQVDAAEDGAANETEVESILKDTVAYVVSAKVASSEGYKAISKDKITDPMKTLTTKNEASVGRFKRLSDVSGETGEGGESGGGSGEGGSGSGEGGEGGESGGGSGSGEVSPNDPPTHDAQWVYTSNNNGTHNIKCGVEGCSIHSSTDNEKCVDNNNDGICDLCKYEFPYETTWTTDASAKQHYHKNTINPSLKKDTANCTLVYEKDTSAFNMHKVKCSVCGHEYGSEACVDDGKGKCKFCKSEITKEEIAITYSASTTAFTVNKDGTIKVTVTKSPKSDVTKYVWEVEKDKKDYVKLENADKDTVKVKALKAGTVNIRCSVEFKDGKKATGAWTPITITAGTSITLDRTAKKAIFVDGDKFTLTATIKGAKTGKVNWSVEDANKDKIKVEVSLSGKDGDAERKATCVVTGLKPGTVTLTCTSADDANIKQSIKIVVVANPKTDKTTKLVDNNGKQVYIYDKSSKKYVEATYADYYSGVDLFTAVEVSYIYNGWWTIDGKTYYFDAKGNKVTGDQVILGAKYSFGSDGALKGGTGLFGIDVSTWNGTIDWKQVAKSGVSYAIIRCGYRGTTYGSLVEDNKFASNIKNASDAGIKVGVYFFTQAVSEAEAVEEASMCLSLVEGYKLSYPIFVDVESGSGNARANGLSKEARTAIVKAFCKTISNSGYKAGVYANKNWLNTKLNATELTAYTIWLAQYASAPSYTTTRYDLWQYSSQGSIKGISGNVDLDLSYLGY